MATVPVRSAVELLAATLTVTVSFPVPVAPAVTVSHEVEVDAVHVQPFEAVTPTVLVSPGVSTVRLAGLMAYVHPAADCAMYRLPAIVSVPLRPWVAVLAVAAKRTAAVPVAGIVDVIVSQLAFDVAVHPHVAPALTVIELVDAADPSDADTADRTGAHGAELAKGFDNDTDCRSARSYRPYPGLIAVAADERRWQQRGELHSNQPIGVRGWLTEIESNTTGSTTRRAGCRAHSASAPVFHPPTGPHDRQRVRTRRW